MRFKNNLKKKRVHLTVTYEYLCRGKTCFRRDSICFGARGYGFNFGVARQILSSRVSSAIVVIKQRIYKSMGSI